MENAPASRRFERVLTGEALSPPPVWIMRQAGRYLPEYRAVRAQAGGFLDLCYNSELATEVTLQPIRRYGFDAAILFADILLLPHALGQELTFGAGEGPRLSPVAEAGSLDAFEAADIHSRLAPVYETVRRLRDALPTETSLIGFAGAPWTVATYMMAGGGSKDPAVLRQRLYKEPEFVDRLIDLLTERTAQYLSRQIEAGANAVQLFDTWAGGLPEDVLGRVSIEPLHRIAAAIKAAHPGVPVILFPKGVGPAAAAYAALPECDAIGIDYAVPWDWARAALSPHAVVQGGLDPLLIVEGGEAMTDAAERLLRTFEGVPYVFNAGHGVTPETPPDNVARLVDYVRERR